MKTSILTCSVILGLSALVTQLLVLREFLNVFSGNELVIGIILGNWLLLSGLGAFFGQFVSRWKYLERWLILFQLALAFLGPLTIVGIRIVKSLTLPGLILGLDLTFTASFLLLLPYCLLSGLLLTLFTKSVSSETDARQIGRIYIADLCGGVIGGALFSFVLVSFFTPFQCVALIFILNIASSLLLFHAANYSKVGLLAFSFLAVIASITALITQGDFETATYSRMFPGQSVIDKKHTPYGSIVLTHLGNQLNIYQNGIPAGSTEDRLGAEESVHFAMSQHASPASVLLVSGALSGTHQEVLKYPIKQLDYLELDPAVIDIVRRIQSESIDPRMRMIAADARKFIQSAQAKYDVIIVSLPDPASAQLNRFYTLEFFEAVHRALTPDGVLGLGLSGAENYASPEMRLMASSVYQAVQAVYNNVLLIPGARQFILASKGKIIQDIAGELDRRQIVTQYINASYLQAKLSPDRLSAAREIVSEKTRLNRDLTPISHYAHLRYWLSQFGGSMITALVSITSLALLLLIIVLNSPRPALASAISSSGFSGMGLTMILILSFQIYHGYLYHQIALLFTMFILGSALGAFWANRTKTNPKSLIFFVDGFLILFASLLPLLFISTPEAKQLGSGVWNLPAMFLGLNGLLGFLIGAQFPLAARLLLASPGQSIEKTTGILYLVDLLGSCLGALVISAISIPLFGIPATCVLLGGIKLCSSVGLVVDKDVDLAQIPAREPAQVNILCTSGVFILLFLLLGLTISSQFGNRLLYGLSFSKGYHFFLMALLAWGLIRAMKLGKSAEPKAKGRALLETRAENFGQAVLRHTALSPFRIVSYLSFGLLIFYPVFRCYFTVPYLFCHVCPRKCVFGFLRPYLIPGALLINLEKRYWCFHACPIGTLHDCQAQFAGNKRRFPSVFFLAALAALAFTIYSYFRLETDYQQRETTTDDWYTYFFVNDFAVNPTVILALSLIFLLAFRYRRSFCSLLCPVGTLSDLVLRLERLLNRLLFRQNSG